MQQQGVKGLQQTAVLEYCFYAILQFERQSVMVDLRSVQNLMNECMKASLQCIKKVKNISANYFVDFIIVDNTKCL